MKKEKSIPNEANGQDRYEYQYIGDKKFIEINTLLSSQLHFVTIINEVQRSLLPEIDLKINVEAPEKGSFIFRQLYQWAVGNSLFAKENVEYWNNLGGVSGIIFSAVGSLYKLFLHLKGGKAKETKEVDSERIMVVNDGGQLIILEKSVFNLYSSNQALNEAFRKQMETLEADPSVEGIKISNSETKEVIIDVPRENFPDFISGNSYLDSDKIVKPKPTIRLFIKKPDLFPKTDKVVWEFIYDGKPIKATITDVSFIAQINNGLRVGQGDSLIADLDIIAEYDKRFNTHIDKRYEITSVKSIEPKSDPPKQMSIL